EGQGFEPKAGGKILLTFEPNFTIGSTTRLTIKDLFKADSKPDRVFTFQGNRHWGFATLEAKGNVEPRAVKLADGRTFPVRMEAGVPAVDWAGLVRSSLPEGFKPIVLSVPADGTVSLNVFNDQGQVVCQLLRGQALKKGEHTIQWDGLTTPSAHRPGQPVPAGSYTWEAIFHEGIGLKLRGWAGNSGDAPWRGWGADHGNPVAAAADPNSDRVFLGWGAGEGDKPLQATRLDGTILWKNIRGGIAGAGPVATDGTTVFAFNEVKGYSARAIYRVEANTGNYTEWTQFKSTDLTMTDLWNQVKDHGLAEVPERPSAIAAGGGKVYVSFSKADAILVVDGVSGAVVKKIAVPGAGGLALAGDGKLYAVSQNAIVRVDTETGAVSPVAKPQAAEKDWVSALAIDKDGNLHAGVRGEGHHHVYVFSSTDGKLLRTIGRKGGRAVSGPWTQDGVFNVRALAVDRQGQLWVAEDDAYPRRVSVWDAKTGAFKKEYFGATHYGATGGAILPTDKHVVIGQGCEWRIDPQTGKSICLGTITREGMGGSRFGTGPGGRTYLATTPAFLHGPNIVHIYERLGEASYKRRATLKELTVEVPTPPPAAGAKPNKNAKPTKVKRVEVWSDVNDDAQVQPDEVKTYDVQLGGWIAGWYMPMTDDLTFYGSLHKVGVTGWTACGAPLYDLSKATKLPIAADAGTRGGMGSQRGHGSVDGRFMLWNATYGVDHGTMDCYDVASGLLAWTYPSNFVGVHGSHRAIPAEPGLMRGAYDIVAAIKLPAPVGNAWVVPTNKGEWHVLTERGFYLTRLFEGDATKMLWPKIATPGISLDTCPPGSGEEAFGGAVTQHPDGSVTVQAGHTSFWNCEVVGLNTIRAIPGGKVSIEPTDVTLAQAARAKQLQQAAGPKRLEIGKLTPTFTGDLDKDFPGATVLKYAKSDATAV
ncbi:MAG: hypothetical protein ACAI43_11860, partial [Phycisphaerae bacterium]